MAEARVRIVNAQGLHARPISSFVQVCSRFEASVEVVGPGGVADGSSVLSMMGLAAARDSELHIRARGSDAESAVAALVELVARGFGEA